MSHYISRVSVHEAPTKNDIPDYNFFKFLHGSSSLKLPKRFIMNFYYLLKLSYENISLFYSTSIKLLEGSMLNLAAFLSLEVLQVLYL